METTEIIAMITIVISLFLLIKVFSLQSQLNNLKSDLEWMRNHADSSPGSSFVKTATVRPLKMQESTVSSDLDERLLSLLQSGQKIKAIKELREARPMGLKEAKDYVENLEQNS
ncbi:ribosomal protein L7/L12 [Paenibacillus dokdonensis]|uniref:Ribosomal protein L7/L12 n=1 Tax=Paenibacillus dokdonensis TaxID=2567944 RepID=A0ABU6GGL3_9BACL|nr:ribosomal protein L7/L12 [Paenibacillus dokdonensis]MEC0238877.1 ribosomal protein L7/L12 [Paenibacillus dokdonensis]